MSILTFNELISLLETGVVRGAQKGHVNGASIDLCLGSKILVEAPPGGSSSVIDLMDKAAPPMREVDLIKAGYFDLSPGQFCLASSLETFWLTNDLVAEFKLKSSLARAGLDHALARIGSDAGTQEPAALAFPAIEARDENRPGAVLSRSPCPGPCLLCHQRRL